MASTSETGHAVNVNNFGKLIVECESFGTRYNPSNTTISMTALKAKLTAASGALKNLEEKESALEKSGNEFLIVFDPLKKLSTRVTNAFRTCGADKASIEDAAGINRKLQGGRADTSMLRVVKAAKLAAKNTQKLAAEGGTTSAATVVPLPNVISVSQQGIAQMLENFARLIIRIKTEPLYNPNEEDLKVTALETYSADLQTKNKAAQEAQSAYHKALSERDRIMYEEITGLVDVAKTAKNYIKSVSGASAPEFKRANSLRFKNAS